MSEFQPEIVVLYCQNSASQEVRLDNAFRQLDGSRARLVVMPCSSKVEIEYMVKILEQGADGIQVVGSGVLRGAADTRTPALIALVGFWGLGFPLAFWLAFRAGHGPQGLWWGLTLGLSSVALLLLARVARKFSRPIAAVAADGD